MEKITSFIVNHNKLQPRVYISRKNRVEGGMVTTFDLRMTSLDKEPVMNTVEMHTAEHLEATFLRNHGIFDKRYIYFGPMGYRTGSYLLLIGDYQPADILPLMVEICELIKDFQGEVPGASPEDYSNYLDMNLSTARYLAGKYLEILYHVDQFPESRLVYPEQTAV